MASASAGKSTRPRARSTYRHGDLRHALLAAGLELAGAGGPDAVVLREATRRAGVVPNAAYRHFSSREDLLEAVRAAALASLAVAMEAELAQLSRTRRSGKRIDLARASLRAVGAGYLKFALSQTGLFRTAFCTPATSVDRSPARVGVSGLNPFELLGSALDLMVEAGALARERRPGAEYLAWSAVHGLALLLIDGPLQSLGKKQQSLLGQRLLDMVEKGL